MSTLTKIAALAIVLSAPAAFAQQYPDSASTPSSSQTAAQSTDYAKLDKNGDGNISKSEAKADPTLSAMFDQLDTDKSGSLSSSELSAAKTKQ